MGHLPVGGAAAAASTGERTRGGVGWHVPPWRQSDDYCGIKHSTATSRQWADVAATRADVTAANADMTSNGADMTAKANVTAKVNVNASWANMLSPVGAERGITALRTAAPNTRSTADRAPRVVWLQGRQ